LPFNHASSESFYIIVTFPTAGPGDSQGIGNPFQQPGAMAKLEADPKTSQYLRDPMFRHQIMAMTQSGSMQ